MLSIVICSIDPERVRTVSANIHATVGVEHEVIIIDNARELGGMGAGYNAGAARARYDLICFMHDDVEFLTRDWGQCVLSHFKSDASLGLIGIAGSRYKSRTISGWWTNQAQADCCNIYQRNAKGKDRKFLLRPAGKNGVIVPVKSLDGVWLCTRRQIWNEFPFNTADLKGFHFYDLDISLRISQQYTVAVVYDVDLVHFSNGNFGDEWVKGAIFFHEQVNKVPLPVSLDKPAENAEAHVCKSWLRRLRIEKISWENRKLWVKAAHAMDYPGVWGTVVGFYFPYVKQAKMKLKALIS
ncbi:glycosyltransferase [Chitinophaga sp.]|uniref:glycosyltransferase n=1 Tax=Chitinophaga sp. TaxID=1869181 RepID=UPI0031CE2F66